MFQRMTNTWWEVYRLGPSEDTFLEWFRSEIARLVKKETKFKLPVPERRQAYTDPKNKAFLARLGKENKKRRMESASMTASKDHHDSDEESE